MIEVSIAFVVSAFIAGMLMFLAPCTLPLVPAYLAFISGVRESDVTASKKLHRKVIYNAVAFVAGFTLIFVGFGILAGLLGFWTGQFRSVLSQVGGVFVIMFALMMLNVVRFIPLEIERKITLPAALTPGTPAAAFLIGATFALGWTPCVGPVLASILLLATTSTSVWSGGVLLLVFSMGLAIPFLVVAIIYTRASSLIARYATYSKYLQSVGGIFLLFVGFLLLTDSFGLMVEYGYRVFNLLGLERIFEYL